MPVELGVGFHIIPYKQGDEVHSIILKEDVSDLWLFQWIRLITFYRPDSRDRNTGLLDINDIRNGFFACKAIHSAFDQHFIACLRVCVAFASFFLLFPDLSDLYIAIRLQTMFLELKTFPTMTAPPWLTMSHIQLACVIHCNG
jgi:hypothetical protein